MKKVSRDNMDRTGGAARAHGAETAALEAWRDLALAGAPRTAKGNRERAVAHATAAVDRARAELTWGRIHLHNLVERVKAADERMAKVPAADRAHAFGRPEPADRAAITTLRPVVERLTYDLVRLGACLQAFRGGETRRLHRAEADQAHKLGPFFISDAPQPPRPCNWCGEAEAAFKHHHALDGAGYVVTRARGTRFCCDRCFKDGRDLAEPAPRPLPVPGVREVERVHAVVDAAPALLPRKLLLSAGGVA